MIDQVPQGELDICDICNGSPHSYACPHHADYDNGARLWVRPDAKEEIGPARFWVEETFASAAQEAGETNAVALREGIAEFELAVREGWIERA